MLMSGMVAKILNIFILILPLHCSESRLNALSNYTTALGGKSRKLQKSQSAVALRFCV